MINILELSIEDLFPNIFNRQYFFVYQDESVYLASVCLIPSIEVYVDGVIVIDDNKPIGRIGSKHILTAYYRFGRDAFYKQSKDIMHSTKDHLKPSSSLLDLLNDFRKNKVGFAPITNDEILAVASIYDVLKAIVKLPMDMSVKGIGSKIITIDENYSIRDALRIMLENNIRRLFIKKDKFYTAIVGRDILGFIMENEIGSNKRIDISNIKIDALDMHKITSIREDTSIRDAIVMLLKEKAPSSLIVEDEYVITPLDIITNIIKYK
ncbi:MAG: hypothetical protein KatS3mg003_2214 [Candidatus Nitrosocaldaceae archaeon]|nr:MAG: hypothetical protein KatS3mg003_2184 [Candidatus Nitrosocaldaceae archaeon]GIU72735.1 MAG: hypothetical protein KatS3mg003_2214 [Candidatus Nitrosocaldaceae archaeon]